MRNIDEVLITSDGLLGCDTIFCMRDRPSAVLQAQGALKRIDIPCSIPGLTTRRLLVMSFIDGLQVPGLRPRA